MSQEDQDREATSAQDSAPDSASESASESAPESAPEQGDADSRKDSDDADSLSREASSSASDKSATNDKAKAERPAAGDEPVKVITAAPEAPAKGGFLANNLIFAVLFIATLAGGFWIGKQIQYYRTDAKLETGERFRVALRGDEPQMGPDDALVTIVMFSDFECPYCSKASGPIVEAVKLYGDDARLIFKHYPLPGHPNALPAAKVAWAAHQQGKFWEMHDWLYSTHGKIDDLPAQLEKLGLDAEQFGKDMASPKAGKAVDDDHFAGGRVGVSGTPSFLVNGHVYSGARDTNTWRKIIDHELADARQLVSSGVARDEVYATLMKDASATRGGGNGAGGAPTARRRPGEPDPMKSYRVPAGEGRPQIGPDDALVTIVEFADFHCPFCAKAADTIKTVQADFSSDVRLVFRQRPLDMHPQARDAAKAALAAHRQGKFWEMHDQLYANAKTARSREQFEAIAGELGLDLAKFQADMDDPAIEEMIKVDEAVASRFGSNGTPAFFINGRFVSGARSVAEFSALVEEELGKAKARVEAGTPRAGVYAAVLKDALPKIEAEPAQDEAEQE